MFAIFFWISVFIILYVYFGYPLLIGLLARLIPERKYSPKKLPSVTLLIAAYNEEEIISRKLENCLELDYPPEKLQILVTADGSDDGTVDIVKSFEDQGVDYTYLPERKGKTAAIARAMQFVRGDVIVFSDANNMYDKRAVRELVVPFADSKVGAVSGAKIILHGDGALGDSESLYWKYESAIKKAEARVSSCVAISGEVWAVRRALFQLPPENIINDDFYMGMQIVRQGYRVAFAPLARSYERVSASPRDERIRRSRMIAGRYQAITQASKLLPFRNPLVSWQIISHKYLRAFVPFAMLGALLFNFLAVLFPASETGKAWFYLSHPFGSILLFFQIAFYGLSLFGEKLDKKSSKIYKLLYLPSFLVNSNFAALVGFFDFVSGRQTVLWERASRL